MGAAFGAATARSVNLSQKLRRPRNGSASACTRGRQARAASAQRAKPFGISASILARIAWPNTGEAPSVEMPMTSGERLTMAPKEKSQNAGRSMTLTGTPAARAAAANCAASSSSAQSATAMAAPAKSSGVPRSIVQDDRPARRSSSERQHFLAGRRGKNLDTRAGGREQFGFPRRRRTAAGDDRALVFQREERRQPRQGADAGRANLGGRAAHADSLDMPQQIEFSTSNGNCGASFCNNCIDPSTFIENSSEMRLGTASSHLAVLPDFHSNGVPTGC